MEYLADILKKGDCFGHNGHPFFSDRCHILVTISDRHCDPTDKVLEVSQHVPGSSSATDFAQRILPQFDDKLLGTRKMTIHWDHPHEIPIEGKVFLLNVVEQFPKTNADWTFDTHSMQLPTRSAVHRDLPFGEDRPIRVLELFSGGYGGWAGSMNFLRQFLQFSVHVVGIDASWDAVQHYSIAHSANIVNGFRPFPSMLLDQDEHTVIWANLGDESFHGYPLCFKPVMDWGPDFLVFSSPCPPWSTAGRNSGLTVEEGMLFAKTVAMCRLLQPPVIGIEQVAGFPAHPHFQVLMHQLRSAGYQILWQGVTDSNQMGSATRQRWLCLAVLQRSPDLQPCLIQQLMKKFPMTPEGMNHFLE